jgi:hypothetical protein
MPLSDLPGEIILETADQLDDAGASALARTNSYMNGFLNGYLYRRDVVKCRSRSLTWAVENGSEATRGPFNERFLLVDRSILSRKVFILHLKALQI